MICARPGSIGRFVLAEFLVISGAINDPQDVDHTEFNSG
jgi:hypothetical protein